MPEHYVLQLLALQILCKPSFKALLLTGIDTKAFKFCIGQMAVPRASSLSWEVALSDWLKQLL